MLVGGAAAWPLAARAQQPATVARIGLLGPTSRTGIAGTIEWLRAGLRDLGYAEGEYLVIEFRWAEGKYDRLDELAAELVRLDVDVIVTHTTPGALAAKRTVRALGPDRGGSMRLVGLMAGALMLACCGALTCSERSFATTDNKHAVDVPGRNLLGKAREGHAVASTRYAQAAPMNPVGIHNERGLQHYRNKDYTRAIAEFSEAIKLDPRSAAPYNNRANSYRALGDLERAARDYSEAIRIDPHPWIFYNRGKIHYLKKDFDRAIEDYDQAIKHGGGILDPEDMTDAYLYRGKSYYEKEEWLPAIVDFDEALRRAPNFMAATASRLLLIDDAAKECTDSPIAARKLRGCDAVIRTMQPSPLLAVALVERAVIYRGQGRVKEAIEDLKKVVAMGAARSSPPGDAAHQRATQILRELEK